jgi:hypothetical protein
MPPLPPDKVFALAGPGHMLTKLWWEIDQLRRSFSTQSGAVDHAPAYHAFNCAVTAWHMADWIWQSGGAQDRTYLLSKFTIAPTGKNRRDFGLFTRALMERHRVLHICRQLATGSKHKIVEMHPDPSVTAEEHWDSDPMRAGSRVGARLVAYSIRLSIRDGDRSRPALEVFKEAAQTWDRLLHEWGYFEARFVGANAE